MTYAVALAFLAILASLGVALLFMLRKERGDKSRSQNMAWALALRVGISIVFFISLLLAWKFGYIHPTGIAAGR
jgi:hypothetical protein